MKSRFLILLALAPCALAQGPLSPPPGPPVANMKSLPEIWDKITGLETEIVEVRAENQRLETLVTQMQAATLPGLFVWKPSMVETAGDVGRYSSIAFAPDGDPAISYGSNADNGTLKFARLDGTVWSIESVQAGDSGADTSLAFGPDGHPAISYYYQGAGTTIGGLGFARYNGSTWDISLVDTATSVGQSSSLAFGPDGHPAISYFDEFNKDLKFARYNGTAWVLTTVDATNFVGNHTSLKFSPDGQPAISYQEYEVLPSYTGKLKFASFDGTDWSISILDTTNSGYHTSLAFDRDGEPAISCLNLSAQDVRVARRSGATWAITSIDNTLGPMIGSDTALVFGPDGQPTVAYYKPLTQDLKYARFAGIWVPSTIDVFGNVGVNVSMAIGPDGLPAMSYYQASNGDLKFIRMSRR